jgi:antitoxin ParD1/3/4
MPTRNINLTDHFDDFVSLQVKQGKYRNASEVMRAGLHLLQQRSEEEAQKLTLLKRLAAEGFDQLDQGQGIILKDFDSLQAHIRKLGRRGIAKAKKKSQGA